jgi:hypothetical protein
MELVLQAMDSSAHSFQISIFPHVNGRLRIRDAKNKKNENDFYSTFD